MNWSFIPNSNETIHLDFMKDVIHEDKELENLFKYLLEVNYKLSDYFDNETLQMFNDIYKKDFEVFNYPMINDISQENILSEYTTIEPKSSLNNSVTVRM